MWLSGGLILEALEPHNVVGWVERESKPFGGPWRTWPCAAAFKSQSSVPTTPRKAHQGVPPAECWTPSPLIRGLFIQSSVKRPLDHITTGGLGVLATLLLCPKCFLERARKPCLRVFMAQLCSVPGCCSPPRPAGVHVQAPAWRVTVVVYVKEGWSTEGCLDGLLFCS